MMISMRIIKDADDRDIQEDELLERLEKAEVGQAASYTSGQPECSTQWISTAGN